MIGRVVALLLVITLSTGTATAQTVRSDLPVVNGAVTTAVVSGNTLYLGGSFNAIGPASGGGTAFDAVSGTPLAGNPVVAGSVYKVVPDGQGGWYIAGDFSAVGGVPRAGLARIRANGTVAPWNPMTNSINIDVTLAVGDSTVYLGGGFTSIAGQTRFGLAAVDTGGGILRPWQPATNSPVTSIVCANGIVYLAGGFTTISGATRGGLASVHPITAMAGSGIPSGHGARGSFTRSGLIGPLGLDDTPHGPGVHEVRFDTGALPNGLYLYRLRAGGAEITRKLVVTR